MKRPSALFAVCTLALAAAALAVRLPRLAQRPMHGDEANQAAKAGILLETGVYEYDPKEHHGPSLYWLTVPSLRLSGANDFAHSTETAYRAVPVVFGASLIVLLLLVADGLGRGPAIIAGILTALSPAMVFYSRYYVQETLLVFFTFAAIGSAWRYCRTRSLGWAIAAGASFGLMHATKETWILAAAAMAAGLILAGLSRSFALPGWVVKAERSDAPGVLRAIGAHLRPGAILAAAVAACLVAVALYSSFGTSWRGPLDSILAYQTYFQRGSDAGIHAHPWDYYLRLLVANRPAKGFFWTEGLIVGLAGVGFVTSLSRWERAGVRAVQGGWATGFCRFLAFYTLVLTVLYSAIPYKTPWCLLSFLHGMILLAGIGAWAILRRLPGWPLKALAAVGLAAGVAHLAWQCYALNFRYCADHQRNPWVYAHTSSNVLELASRMERLAGLSPDGHDMVIHVVTPENCWPLPWYLRRFNADRIGYWQDPAAWSKDTAQHPPPSVIILTPDVQEAVDAHLAASYTVSYNRQMLYGLRPEVFLSVYVRDDLWQKFLSAAVRGNKAGNSQ